MKPRLSSAMQAAAEKHELLLAKLLSAKEPPVPIERLKELYLIQRAGFLDIEPEDVAVPLHKKHLFECPWADLIPQDRIFLANVYIASPDCVELHV